MLVPGVWVVYSKTRVCTHGQTYEPRGNGKRVHNSVRDTKCTVRVNARVTATSNEEAFQTFPEVITVDTTHDTNSNRYKLFSFVVHDVFVKGQYVHYALVQTEHMVNLRRVMEIFKSNNPEWTKVRVVITDKAFHEKKVLLEIFPKAHQLFCQWHVLTWLKKQAGRLAPNVKKEVKSLIRLLVYAESTQGYEDAKVALLEQLGGDSSHPLYKTFQDNWDSSQEEWVTY
ncbi:hypothetical protein PHMEG_00024425 [Phytophthora megakarya]|uniref:ZSWIM1/3 RNaseH-like domain-containing protein n=1 Tax=Phytophthora megakarya TaxID=4795 RepID=A0A225VEJ0_9STRA|nr:hypothetical protein PHMEG_00024425 [Phytophthora megakarya]